MVNDELSACQHSRYCDLRHLKALGWMVSGLICSRLSMAWPYVSALRKSPKCRAALAAIHEQCPNSSRSAVSTVSDGCFEWVATRAGLPIGHDRSVEPLLYDSSVGGLLWASRPLLWRVEHNSATVASVNTGDCSAPLAGYCAVILM